MNGYFAFFVESLVQLSPFALVLVWVFTIVLLILYKPERLMINIPMHQGFSCVLMTTSLGILAASILAGVAYVIGNLFGNHGSGIPFVGALVGGIIGISIGWALQKRFTV